MGRGQGVHAPETRKIHIFPVFSRWLILYTLVFVRGWVHLTGSRVAVKQTRMDPTVLILTSPDHNFKNIEFAIMS